MKLLPALLLAPLPACPDLAAPPSEGNMSDDALRAKSDDFSAPALHPGWSVLNRATFRLSLEGGALRMEPTQNVVWWKADQGPAVVHRIRGNFRLTAQVRTRKGSAPTRPPDRDFQFGGIIVRDPRSDEPDGRENYVFSVVGYRGTYLSAETKSTRDDESDVSGPSWDSGDAELRICRLGALFHLYDRKIGGARWHHAITYHRADLPSETQAGLIAYALSERPDLRVEFDWVRFAPARG